MKQIKALVITGYGTNCEREMAHACRLTGAQADIVHISEIVSGRFAIPDYHFLNLAGGFLDGDDLGSAQVESVRMRYARIKTSGKTIYEDILTFIAQGGLILGVCNGFQALVKSGLLPGLPFGRRRVSLTFNDSGRFEDRWVRLTINPQSPCIFTRGITRLSVPVRHGEGKFLTDNEQTLGEISGGNLDVLKYADADFNPTMCYPENPNGSINAIAGICDPSGRIFGLMPHPEAFTHYTNHPQWTRMKNRESQGEGLYLFENALTCLRDSV